MNTSHKAILLPLLGLAMAWVLFMFASWSNLFIQPEYNSNGMWLNDGPTIRPSTYLYLLGIALYSLASLMSLRMSAREFVGNESDVGSYERPIALAIWPSSSVSPGARFSPS